jgi:hypothetical protein
VDVWCAAVGLVGFHVNLVQLMCKTEIFSFAEIPWPNVSNGELPRKVRLGERMSAPAGCPARVYSIMAKCWEYNPHVRISAEELSLQLAAIQKNWDVSPQTLWSVSGATADGSDEEEDIDNTHI